jgi:hypothetical protein
MGKVICNGILFARMIHLLHQINCNEPILTLFRSWMSCCDCLPLTTEWSGSHRLLASTLVAGGSLSPCKYCNLASFWVSWKHQWCYCPVTHNFEASLAWILFEKAWWVSIVNCRLPTADCRNKRMSMSMLSSSCLTASTAPFNTTLPL